MNSPPDNSTPTRLEALSDAKRALAERLARAPRRVQRGFLRRMARRHEKAAHKAELAAAESVAAGSYCCPKCHTWHPTPEARRECRLSHKKDATP